MLAVCVLREQDVEVLAVSFVTPFFGSARAREAASRLGVPLREIDITGPHLDMVKSPRFGYGRNMNPCIDCHAMMLNVAGSLMEKEGFDFLFTGEVLNERPKSQTRGALDVVARESGYPDLVLRPLSAKLLTPTKPERTGLIDRERLLALKGRSRKSQFELAKKYGITEYPSPAGGCLLTDPGYSRRLRDLFEHEPDAGADDVRLLRLGRHLRLGPHTKLVLGRNRAENEDLEKRFQPGDAKLFVKEIPGPTGLLRGPAAELTEDVKHLAAAICARYSDAPPEEPVPVVFIEGERQYEVPVIPATAETIEPRMV